MPASLCPAGMLTDDGPCHARSGVGMPPYARSGAHGEDRRFTDCRVIRPRRDRLGPAAPVDASRGRHRLLGGLLGRWTLFLVAATSVLSVLLIFVFIVMETADVPPISTSPGCRP